MDRHSVWGGLETPENTRNINDVDPHLGIHIPHDEERGFNAAFDR